MDNTTLRTKKFRFTKAKAKDTCEKVLKRNYNYTKHKWHSVLWYKNNWSLRMLFTIMPSKENYSLMDNTNEITLLTLSTKKGTRYSTWEQVDGVYSVYSLFMIISPYFNEDFSNPFDIINYFKYAYNFEDDPISLPSCKCKFEEDRNWYKSADKFEYIISPKEMKKRYLIEAIRSL